MTVPVPPVGPPPTEVPSWRRSVGVLAGATIAIGVANYLVSLAGVHLLSAGQFSDFAAGQSLLLVLGTGSFAALPWAVARYLARSDDPDAPARAMHFGLTGSALQALVLAPVAVAVCWSLGGAAFGLVGGLATAMICLLAGPIGFLQGRQLLPTIAAVRALETVGRIGATVVLVLLVSRSATLALLGFPVGSALALVYALRRGRAGFPLRPLSRPVALALTRDAALLGGIQVLLAMLGALDTVYADAGDFTSTQTAGYQAAALLARIPLFFSAAIATAAYTELAAAPDEADAGRHLRAALRTFGWLAAPFLVAYLTVPRSLLDLLIPAKYGDTLSALRALCVAGVAIGVINVVTTAHQARGRFRTGLTILAGGVLVQALVLLALGHAGRLIGFAVAASAVSVVTLAALLIDARRWLASDPATTPAVRSKVLRVRAALRPRHAVLAAATVGAVAAELVHQPILWIAGMAVVTIGCASTAFTNSSPTTSSPPSTTGSTAPRIQELAR